jgi:hypothetical protein
MNHRGRLQTPLSRPGSVGVRGSSPLSSTHLSRVFFIMPLIGNCGDCSFACPYLAAAPRWLAASRASFYAEESRTKPDGAPDIHVGQVSVDQAHAFELGYPEPGVAYVRHPVRATRLIPLASYHPTITVEKVTDAIAMLTALGAAEIVLAYGTEVSNEVRADLD